MLQRSILAVQERHQGAYRAVVQQGPFSHAGVAAMTDISEVRACDGLPAACVSCSVCNITDGPPDLPASLRVQPAYVFVQPVDAPEKDASCAICLSVVPTRERFRFRRKAEESYNSGFRNLSPAGTFAEELQYCRHAHRLQCTHAPQLLTCAVPCVAPACAAGAQP
jgi:hypothetical protein